MRYNFCMESILIKNCEPCQVRKEAAISRPLRVPQECLFLWPIEKIRTGKSRWETKSLPAGLFCRGGKMAVRQSIQEESRMLSRDAGSGCQAKDVKVPAML